MTTDDTANSGHPEGDGAPAEPERIGKLADQLARHYDYQTVAELEQEDPDRAQEHRDAAATLASWIRQCPREDRRAAFQRGYDRGVEVQKSRTAAAISRLEAEIEELRQDRDPEALRARITDLEYVLKGWGRFATAGIHGAAPDWKAQAAEYLVKLTEAQRDLAVLKGVQPSNATGERPS